ncbi:unnamed protein product [Staurois parvus]|uniref:G-protein coupled receptors family 1 profile domain-containing protein n=1 Tax=Staurois parvus TaxID=386267 RepID=A0ABN9HML9_9NEOB|nr:unnamed protein product [Staurois parvus]
MALSDLPDIKVLLFCILLLLYLLTLTGNTVIIVVSYLDRHLHKPMYFFLGNLAFLDICYTSTTMPQILQVLLAKTKSITFIGCVTQVFFFVVFVGTEHILLLIMSYDRFLAICRPLRYMVMMSQNVCARLAFVCWFIAVVNSTVHTSVTFRLHFCRTRKIENFFCDIPPLLSISCDDTSINEALLLSVGAFIGWAPLISIIISYIYIIVTIMKIKSEEGRQKAFSTCVSHLTVVILYYGSAIFNYAKPASAHSTSNDRLISVLYSMVIPMLNPVIYTLKNQDVKDAINRQFIQKTKL